MREIFQKLYQQMSKYGVNGAKFGDDIGVSLVMLSTERNEISHTMYHIPKAPTRTLLKAPTHAFTLKI